MRIWPFLLFFALACTSKSQEKSEERAGIADPNAPANCSKNMSVVGGASVIADEHKEFSATVAILSTVGALCTGTHIGSGHVVTAAHCLQGHADTRFIAYVGSSMNNASGSARAVRRQAHPNYYDFSTDDIPQEVIRTENGKSIVTDGSTFDIGWLKLDSIPKGLGTARIGVNVGLTAGTRLRVGGYGNTVETTEGGTGNLNWADIRFGDRIQNFRIPFDTNIDWEYSRLLRVDPQPGRGICTGDSGGPALAQDDSGTWTLVGVSQGVIEILNPTVDFDNGYICQSGEGLFVSVADHIAWLRSSTGLALDGSEVTDPENSDAIPAASSPDCGS